MNFKRRIALAAAALALVTGTAFAQGKDKVVLLLNWYTYSEHAPFYLGKARGYFDAENIDLDIQEGRGSGVTVQAVAAGTATFGYADVPTMMRAASKGAPVIAVGVALQTSPMSVMGFCEKNIRKPEDIKGKTVAVTPGDSMSQIWPLFLKKTGLKQDDFKQVAGDAQTKLNAVINGQADLLLGYVMDQAIKLQDATHKQVCPIRFADYGVNMVSSGIIVQKDLLKTKPDMVKRFLRAATRALEESAKDPAAAIDAMLKANPKSGVRDTALIGMKETARLYKGPDNPNDKPLRVGAKNMAETLQLLVDYGGLDKASAGKPEDYYTNAYLP
ncbi:MAG TPA: ABC transporter substrate-binding protein [Casimicrobiaceae bacterium]|jgi:NitT/TauT family transport system substrate-binding protein|nr:ABC transporter substrate-binding protein [Casimicrobiaceae bacterium]